MERGHDDKLEAMIGYIMKMCLWQFHSRAWDRERQNREILGMTLRLLLGDEVSPETPEERCYYADAEIMRRGFLALMPDLAGMAREELTGLLTAVRERLDYLTVGGSLNQELTDVKY
ncbi:MAG: Fe-only/vanadium nitrogenase subunit delta [Deltaproteobacteria bacterium]|jgi:nitrogenase delta subunit|nr:Fe-only/vanadium nitrogenase subunit delta [Deltaproteobacteria bacterium]